MRLPFHSTLSLGRAARLRLWLARGAMLAVCGALGLTADAAYQAAIREDGAMSEAAGQLATLE